MPGLPAPASTAIAWRRLDQPAYEAATLAPVGDGWVLAGDVRGDDETGQPYVLRYVVRADAAWRTDSARVEGMLGRERVQVVLARHAATGTWTRDGVATVEVTGCLDVDLGFTPATNTLAIRAQLEVDEAGLVTRYGDYWVADGSREA